MRKYLPILAVLLLFSSLPVFAQVQQPGEITVTKLACIPSQHPGGVCDCELDGESTLVLAAEIPPEGIEVNYCVTLTNGDPGFGLDQIVVQESFEGAAPTDLGFPATLGPGASATVSYTRTILPTDVTLFNCILTNQVVATVNSLNPSFGQLVAGSSANIIVVQVNCPDNLDFECDEIAWDQLVLNAETGQYGSPNVLANCCQTAGFSAAVQTTVFDGCDGVITRTWDFSVSNCPNFTGVVPPFQCVQVITWTDSTPPVLTCPADVELECPADTSPAITGEATAEDSCNDVTVDYSDVFDEVCPGTGVIIRTWTAVDSCGNAAEPCVQFITIEDNIPPVLSNCPADVILDCDDPLPTDEPTFTDECDLNPVVTFNETEEGCDIIRTWYATDCSGNVSETCTQIITQVGVDICGYKLNSDTGAGIGGWTIYLYDTEGNLLDTTTTGADGRFCFLGVDPGNYVVVEEDRDGYTPTAGTERPVSINSDQCCTIIEVDPFLNQPDRGAEGCTPGFWKNHPNVWVGYTTGQTLESVFDVPDSLGLDNATLLQALNFGGGGGVVGAARNLLRAAVAALLNASNPDIAYTYTEAEIIAMVNAALATNNRATILALATELDDLNNNGCTIDAHGNIINGD